MEHGLISIGLAPNFNLLKLFKSTCLSESKPTVVEELGTWNLKDLPIRQYPFALRREGLGRLFLR